MSWLRIVGPHQIMPSDDCETDARRSVSCTPFRGARHKQFALRLRPLEANIYIVVCENANRLRPYGATRGQSGRSEYNDCDMLITVLGENFEWNSCEDGCEGRIFGFEDMQADAFLRKI